MIAFYSSKGGELMCENRKQKINFLSGFIRIPQGCTLHTLKNIIKSSLDIEITHKNHFASNNIEVEITNDTHKFNKSIDMTNNFVQFKNLDVDIEINEVELFFPRGGKSDKNYPKIPAGECNKCLRTIQQL